MNLTKRSVMPLAKQGARQPASQDAFCRLSQPLYHRNRFGVRLIMRDFRWSSSEKKIARAAFDLAFKREIESVRCDVESMLEQSSDPNEIWRIHDHLTDKRREIDRKYDYRYSVLISVFGRLIHEGWLTEEDLSGLSHEKLEAIRCVVSLDRELFG